MTRRVLRQRPSLIDLDEAADYLQRQGGPQLAIRFLREVDATSQRLAAIPGIGTHYGPMIRSSGMYASFLSLGSRNTSCSTGRSKAGSKSFASCTVPGTFQGFSPKAWRSPMTGITESDQGAGIDVTPVRPVVAPSPSATRPRLGRHRAVVGLRVGTGSNTMAIKMARGTVGRERSNPMATIAPTRPKTSSPPPSGTTPFHRITVTSTSGSSRRGARGFQPGRTDRWLHGGQDGEERRIGWTTKEVLKSLDRRLPAGWTSQEEEPVRIPAYDEPEPDIAIIRGTDADYRYRIPTAAAWRCWSRSPTRR